MGNYAEYGYDKAEGVVIVDRPKAILFQEQEKDKDVGEPYWIPKSQIHDNSEVWKKGDVGMIVVTEWFARKMEWI